MAVGLGQPESTSRFCGYGDSVGTPAALRDNHRKSLKHQLDKTPRDHTVRASVEIKHADVYDKIQRAL